MENRRCRAWEGGPTLPAPLSNVLGKETDMRLILHIGAPKTGTTHLQTSLNRSRRDLRAQGILYPRAGTRFEARTTARHVGLRFACAPDDVDMSWMMASCGMEEPAARHAYAPTFWADLSAEVTETADVHTVIVSDEALFSFSDERMIAPMMRALRSLFSEISVVAFLRRPSEVIQGIYSQRVKKGSALTWQDFIDERLDEPLYLEQLKLWQDQLAPHELIVRPSHGDIITQFLDTVDLQADVSPAPKGTNKSLSAVGIKILRKINEKASRNSFEKNATGAKWVPDAADCLAIDAIYRAEIDGIIDSFALGASDLRLIRDWYEAPAPSAAPLSAEAALEAGLEEMANAILDISNPAG